MPSGKRIDYLDVEKIRMCGQRPLRIFTIPVDSIFQPPGQPFRYPSHNRDFGIEQDFLLFLERNPHLTSTSPSEADFHYLPVFWTRWHLNHDYGKTGLLELQNGVNRALLDDSKTFTICQYDDGPCVNVGATIQFLGSRKGREGIDVPLLCARHHIPLIKPRRRYIASFVGRDDTHPIRKELLKELAGLKEYYVSIGDGGEKHFVHQTLSSYACLAPRGYGGSSFRFFEAMQLGVAPFLIGDLDTRPFKQFIRWDSFSFYSALPNDVSSKLERRSTRTLRQMGKIAHDVYQEELCYQEWCRYVILELQMLKRAA